MQIRDIPLISTVNEEQIHALMECHEISLRKCGRNETVYNRNSECSGMDIVLSGGLVAYALSSNGSESVVFDFQKGSVIGANLLFGNVNRYPLNIYCTQSCELLHLSKAAVSELLHNYGFMMNFVQSISQNSQGMNQKIAIYTKKSLRENLLDYFEALSVEQESKTIRLPISKKQMADYFGVQRPSLFRELKKLKDEGVIDIQNKEITIAGDSIAE